LKSSELNRLLVKSFPNLSDVYTEEVEWQEGDNTGSHTVYGDVFTPYLVNCITNDSKEEMSKALLYIEELLALEDSYVDEVVAFSILESIAYLFEEKQSLMDLIGERTKLVIKDFL